MHGRLAGQLAEESPGGACRFQYAAGYDGPPISQTLLVKEAAYDFPGFPPFFDGLLPEGWQLEALLRKAKLDRSDRFGQLLAVGGDVVGAVTVGAEP